MIRATSVRRSNPLITFGLTSIDDKKADTQKPLNDKDVEKGGPLPGEVSVDEMVGGDGLFDRPDHVTLPPRNLMLRNSARMHTQHTAAPENTVYDYEPVDQAAIENSLDNANAYDDDEYIEPNTTVDGARPSYIPEKKNNFVLRWWKALTGKRIPGSQWTTGTSLLCHDL